MDDRGVVGGGNRDVLALGGRLVLFGCFGCLAVFLPTSLHLTIWGRLHGLDPFHPPRRRSDPNFFFLCPVLWVHIIIYYDYCS